MSQLVNQEVTGFEREGEARPENLALLPINTACSVAGVMTNVSGLRSRRLTAHVHGNAPLTQVSKRLLDSSTNELRAKPSNSVTRAVYDREDR